MAQMQASFRTAKGSLIELRIETQEAAPVMGVTRPIWDLVAQINGGAPTAFVRLTTHPVHGDCLQIGNSTAPIPADKLAEVKAVMDTYMAPHREALQAETEHQQRRARILRAMNP